MPTNTLTPREALEEIRKRLLDNDHPDELGEDIEAILSRVEPPQPSPTCACGHDPEQHHVESPCPCGMPGCACRQYEDYEPPDKLDEETEGALDSLWELLQTHPRHIARTEGTQALALIRRKLMEKVEPPQESVEEVARWLLHIDDSVLPEEETPDNMAGYRAQARAVLERFGRPKQ